MEISELMTPNAIRCRTDDTLDEAAQRMWDHDCGCLPVTDDDTRVAGMITDRDICMAAHFQGRALGSVRVRDAMARGVRACHADAEQRLILATLRELGGDKPKAAETLGISLETLYTRLAVYRAMRAPAQSRI